MTLFTGIEILLDGFLLFLLSFGIFSERRRMTLRDGLFGICFILFCGISRLSVLVDSDTFFVSVETQGYEIVPANGLPLFLFLIIAVIITNSFLFRKNAMFTFFGTLAVFSAFIISRMIFILLLYGLGTVDNTWNPFISRLSSTFLLCMVLCSTFLKWLRDKLNNGSLTIKFLIANTTALLCTLIILLDFDVANTADHLIIISGTIASLFIINLLVGIYAQKRSAEKKRINMIEQYIPVIEELITQVRARQHEFNNRLLAISAATQTASSLEQAKAEIAELTTGMQFDISEKSLLNCDSKIIAGMIFSKIKYAELKKITIVTEIAASIKDKAVQELDIIEIVGILIDNAIEASNAGETIYIKIEHIGKGLSILVSNPYAFQSAIDFVRMFRRGFSTKAEGGVRGHGLANVKALIDRHRGKIITRNETVHEQNYVTIGVFFS